MGRITTTASGVITSFKSPKEASIRSLKVYLEPKQAGTGDPSTSNVRAISGWTGVNILRTGKNLFNPATPYRTIAFNNASKITTKEELFEGMRQGQMLFYGVYYDSVSNGIVKVNDTNSVMLILPVKPNTKYMFRGSIGSGERNRSFIKSKFWFYDAEMNPISDQTVGTVPSVSVPDNAQIRYAMFYVHNYAQTSAQNPWSIDDVQNTLQIEVGTEATAYEPFTGTITTSWQTEAGTVYGGYVDLISGVLTVTAKYYEFDGSEDEGWKYSDKSLDRYRFYSKSGANGSVPGMDYGDNKTSVLACNYLHIAPNGTSADYAEFAGSIITSGSYNRQLYVAVTFATTLEEWTTYLSQNHLTVVGKLQTPVTYQLTARELNALRGHNNILAGGNNIEVSYDFAETADMFQTRKRIMEGFKSIAGLPVIFDNVYLDGGYNTATGNLKSNSNYFVTGFFDTGSTGTKTYKLVKSSKPSTNIWPYIRWFNNKKFTCADYWGFHADADREVSATGQYVLATVYKPWAGKFYIIDYTNKRYVCKGNKVTTIPEILQYDKKYYAGNPINAPVDDTGTCITKTYRFQLLTATSTIVTYGAAGPGIEFKGEHADTYVDWWSLSSTTAEQSRNILHTNTNGMAFTLKTSMLDNAYAYIQDTGEILFAGPNSVYYNHLYVTEVS